MTQTVKPVRFRSKIDTFFGVSFQIIVIVFSARFIMDIGTRILYPFIPQISEGLGLTVVGFSWLIFIRSMVGISGPIFGLLSDRYGRRKLMALGLFCQATGVMGVALSWQWWATLPMIFFGLGLAAFLPAQQAYISDQVIYQKRGRALAAIEFSWAASAIFILPLIGWMIDKVSWYSPFLMLALLSLIGTLMVWFRLPPAEHHSHPSLSWSEIRAVCFRPSVLASITVSMLLFVAVTTFITIWGIWLTAGFGLSAATLGLVATGIGVAELGGSSLSGLFIDRLGKRRGSQLGLLCLAIIMLLLPLTQNALFMAISLLIITGTCLEFTIVSLIPLYSEQVPEARATVFALVFSGVGFGAALGTPITAILWEQYGLWAVCAVAAVCVLIAYNILGKFVHEVSPN